MRNSYYISLKSVPVISHNFDTINTSTIADANKFKPWKTYRRRSSVLQINNPQTLSLRKQIIRPYTSREISDKQSLTKKSKDDGIQLSDDILRPKQKSKKLMNWKVYDPHVPSNRQLVIARPLLLQLPYIDNSQGIIVPSFPIPSLKKPQTSLTIEPSPLSHRRTIKFSQRRPYMKLHAKRKPENLSKQLVQVPIKPWELIEPGHFRQEFNELQLGNSISNLCE